MRLRPLGESVPRLLTSNCPHAVSLHVEERGCFFSGSRLTWTLFSASLVKIRDKVARVGRDGDCVRSKVIVSRCF